MQQERERPAIPQQTQPQPPAYAQHDPQSLELPSVPTHSLPSLRSLALPDARASRERASIELSPKAVNAQWVPAGALHSAAFPRVPEGDVGSPMDVDRCSVVSGEERRREMSVLSVDDPDVRLAAEALSGLGNPGQFSPRVVCMPMARRHTWALHALIGLPLRGVEACGHMEPDVE
jgi:hypothetical protein